jgi:hypothetical protein
MHSKESSTRVPTQITCKFLDSTSVAWAEEGGGIIGVNLIPSTFVFRHLLSHRENRGGHRCVRGRIIGSESGLSTRCNNLRRNSPKSLTAFEFLSLSPMRRWSNLRHRRLVRLPRASPSGICAFRPGSNRSPGGASGPFRPLFRGNPRPTQRARRPGRSSGCHQKCWSRSRRS